MPNGSSTNRVERLGGGSGASESGVDRLSGGSNPGAGVSKLTSRERQTKAKKQIASKLNLDREGIGSVARLSGLDVFLRSEGQQEFGNQVAEQFASGADFVKPSDVDPNVNGDEISANPVVASGRRDDVAQRTRQQLAGDRQFAKPSDFDVDVGKRGVTAARLTPLGKRRVASRELEAETPLSQVDPSEDLTKTDSGFGLDTAAKRRSAARGFEDNIGLFEQGELSPSEDLRKTDSGFGLAREEARKVAAQRIDADLPNINVEPSDVTLELTDSGEFSATFKKEVRR